MQGGGMWRSGAMSIDDNAADKNQTGLSVSQSAGIIRFNNTTIA